MTKVNTTRPKTKKRVKRSPTTARGQWQHVVFRVRHTPNYILQGTDHIELIVISPKREPLPISATGYLSHFTYDSKQVPNAKAALAFFLAWMEREAKTKAWQKADAAWQARAARGDVRLAGSSPGEGTTMIVELPRIET